MIANQTNTKSWNGLKLLIGLVPVLWLVGCTTVPEPPPPIVPLPLLNQEMESNIILNQTTVAEADRLFGPPEWVSPQKDVCVYGYTFAIKNFELQKGRFIRFVPGDYGSPENADLQAKPRFYMVLVSNTNGVINRMNALEAWPHPIKTQNFGTFSEYKRLLKDVDQMQTEEQLLNLLQPGTALADIVLTIGKPNTEFNEGKLLTYALFCNPSLGIMPICHSMRTFDLDRPVWTPDEWGIILKLDEDGKMIEFKSYKGDGEKAWWGSENRF